MYQSYFGLNELPFSIAPDPRYLYLSEQHREVLAHLLYGVQNQGGFVVITGEVGTGKTTVCRSLLQQLPDTVDVAFIFNPKLNTNELLQSICTELGLKIHPRRKRNRELMDQINDFLLENHAKGRSTLLIIDEAQNLSREVLEQIRLLTNLETNEKKLLQLILLGQPELQDMLAEHDLRQLAQRVTARYHLRPLSRQEVRHYMEHRLAVAGGGSQRPVFQRKAIKRIYQHSKGIPRLINVISDRIMLAMYATDKHKAGKGLIDKAAAEVLGEAAIRKRRRWPWLILLLTLSAAVAYACYEVL